MNHWREEFNELKENPKTWLITGVAGFIGSNLLEHLLLLNQKVVGLDNLSMGFWHNFDLVRKAVPFDLYDNNFRFIEGDIRNREDCEKACEGVDYVLHQAAVGSVPKSIEDPIRTHENNVNGFVNILNAARNASVKSFVFASSSSVYGDTEVLPQIEEETGNLLSPYAASKRTGELFAQTFDRCYDISCTGLRYFNVFGPRQNPKGDYAAVIPKWIDMCLKSEPCKINGDGKIYRDFTHVENVVYANLLAAIGQKGEFQVFNAALGGKVTLADLHQVIRDNVGNLNGQEIPEAINGPNRVGDILTSSADITKIQNELNFKPVMNFEDGIASTVQWFAQNPSA